MRASRPSTIYTAGSITDDGKLVLSKSSTVPTCEHFLTKFHHHEGTLTLRSWNGFLYSWNGRRYEPVDEACLGRQLLLWLNRCVSEDGEQFPANPRSVKAVIDSLKLMTALPSGQSAPCWLSAGYAGVEPTECVPLANGIFHLPTKRLLEHTPEFFAVHGADFEYDADAPEPVEWIKFLTSLFSDDVEQIRLLREWLAYCLVADNSLQKILTFVSPPRGGKGTISRVLKKLIGEQSICSPTLGSLNGEFGLQQLIGKTLALVSDARVSGIESNQNLLRISGGDPVSINRKYGDYMPAVVLPVRFMFLTNELPKLNDASKALSRRMLILNHEQSFVGKEDVELERRLLRELPGIFNWCIEAWQPLKDAGRFTVPASTLDVAQQLDELASPVTAWLNECCEVGEGEDYRLDTRAAFQSWCEWCHTNGHKDPGTAAAFGAKFKSAFPNLEKAQGTHARFYRGIRHR